MAKEVDEFKEKDKDHPIEIWTILYFYDLWWTKLPNRLPFMLDI